MSRSKATVTIPLYVFPFSFWDGLCKRKFCEIMQRLMKAFSACERKVIKNSHDNSLGGNKDVQDMDIWQTLCLDKTLMVINFF